MNYDRWEPKHSGDIDWFYVFYCDPTGLNDGSAADRGILASATIASHTVTVPSGITKVTDNRSSVTFEGVTFPANTLIAVQLSGGVNGRSYDVDFVATLSDGRIIERTRTLKIRDDI